MSDNVIWTNFGKAEVVDPFFEKGRPIYTFSVSFQSPRWWSRLTGWLRELGS